MDVKNLETAYAIPNGAADGSRCPPQHKHPRLPPGGAKRPPEARNALEAERLGKVVVGHLRYLMMLDRFTTKEEEGGGVKWFVGMDELGVGVEGFAKREADSVASYVFYHFLPSLFVFKELDIHDTINRSLGLPHVPLDIFLHRSHALPLPVLLNVPLTTCIPLHPPIHLILSILTSKQQQPPKT